MATPTNTSQGNKTQEKTPKSIATLFVEKQMRAPLDDFKGKSIGMHMGKMTYKAPVKEMIPLVQKDWDKAMIAIKNDYKWLNPNALIKENNGITDKVKLQYGHLIGRLLKNEKNT